MRIRKPLRALARILLLRAPVEAQLIVTRRCNLSCGYCTEYDHSSAPVPFELLAERIDALHRLRVVNISLLGGEPLLHPRIGDVVAYAARRAQVSITTNGFLLSDRVVERLNEAGLSNMQVSIDALRPDPTGYIQKSLKSLAPKLRRLRRLARFGTHVNVVLCESSRDDFVATLDELREAGFPVSVNLVHDDRGLVQIGGPEYLRLWEYHYRRGTPLSRIEYEYGTRLLRGERPGWRCRAGARFLYVDEFGKVQFCSAQRGRLDKPVTAYTREDIRRHGRTLKGCEAGCSIFCVYRASQVDNAPIAAAHAAFRMLRRATRPGGPPAPSLTAPDASAAVATPPAPRDARPRAPDR